VKSIHKGEEDQDCQNERHHHYPEFHKLSGDLGIQKEGKGKAGPALYLFSIEIALLLEWLESG